MIDQPLALAAVIATLTALAFWLDRNVKPLATVGASLIAIVLGALLSNAGLVPVSSGVYDVITGPITSLAVAWLLLSVNLADVKRAGPRMITAFGIAVVGTALGSFVAALVFAPTFGEDMWRIAGTLTGSYSGGSLNFAAVAREVELPTNLFAGAAAADNLTTGLWLGATLTLPIWLGRFYPTPIPGTTSVAMAEGVASGESATEDGGDEPYHTHPFDQRTRVSTVDLAMLAAVGIGLLVLADLIALVVPAIPSILWLTTLALIAGHTPWLRSMPGAFQMGTLALHLFFVVIGIFSRVSEIMSVGIEVLYLTLTIVGIHGIWTFGVGRIAKIDVGTLAVASQAAIGGPSSALAIAVSREWRALVLPGIVVGLLGYAVGNYAGLGVAYLVRALAIGL